MQSYLVVVDCGALLSAGELLEHDSDLRVRQKGCADFLVTCLIDQVHTEVRKKRLVDGELSLFVDSESANQEPAVDETFVRAIRRPLDEASWVEIVPSWVTGSQTLLSRLLASISFTQRRRWMYNKLIDEPRLTAEYRDLSSAPEPFVSLLADALTRRYGVVYDGIWMNLYRNHRDSTGWHGDWHTCKREECIVPVVSLGATRRFLLKPRAGGSSVTFVVKDGDLLVMGGRCQRNWRHSVPKQTVPAGVRVSINFSSRAQALETP